MGVNLPWCQPVLTLVKCVPTLSQWTFTFSFMTCCKSCAESQWMELACVLRPQSRTSSPEPQGCCLLIHISLHASPTLNKHYQRVLAHFWKPDSQLEESTESFPSALFFFTLFTSFSVPRPSQKKMKSKKRESISQSSSSMSPRSCVLRRKLIFLLKWQIWQGMANLFIGSHNGLKRQSAWWNPIILQFIFLWETLI